MVKLYEGGVWLVNQETLLPASDTESLKALTGSVPQIAEAKKGTIT